MVNKIPTKALNLAFSLSSLGHIPKGVWGKPQGFPSWREVQSHESCAGFIQLFLLHMENKKKLCPHCRQEVDPKASRCPHCQGKIYQWTLGRKLILGLLVLLGISIAMATASPSPARSPEVAAQEAAELAAWQKTPAGQLCAKHPDWKRPACDAIVEKKVMVGMSKEQAIVAWGKPKDINTTATAGGTHEQWVYNSGTYIYFDDGILSAIQN